MSLLRAVKWLDTLGASNAFKNVDGKPRICANTYFDDIAEGHIADHSSWTKIGYTPTMNTTESDLWSAAGVYTFLSAAAGLEVLSSDNTKDIGTSIHSGTSTGGSTTTLIDSGANFSGGTAVAVGDVVLLDKSGTTPEWGYVTAVTSSTQLTVAGGFSLGGTGSGRAYAVVDKSAYTGAHVVKLEYLTAALAEKSEIVILNGTTEVATVNTDIYRVNSFRIIATGTDNKPTGNITLRHTSNTPVISYITAGYTRARNCVYTVPAGKQLFVQQFTVSYGYATNQTHYCRLYTRANIEPSTRFNTGSLFFPYSEVICANTSQEVSLKIATRLPAGTDIKVSGIASFAGIAQCTLRGHLESI